MRLFTRNEYAKKKTKCSRRHIGLTTNWILSRSTCQIRSRTHRHPIPYRSSTKLFGHYGHLVARWIGCRFPLYASQQFGVPVQQTDVGCVGVDILHGYDLWTNVESYSFTAIIAPWSKRRHLLHSWIITSAISHWIIHCYVPKWVWWVAWMRWLQQQKTDNFLHGFSCIWLTFLLRFLCGIIDAMIALGMIFLTEAGQQSDQRKGRFMAITGLVLVSIFFSLILSVFRSKAQGYPYR